jgi:hypothetical protein
MAGAPGELGLVTESSGSGPDAGSESVSSESVPQRGFGAPEAAGSGSGSGSGSGCWYWSIQPELISGVGASLGTGDAVVDSAAACGARTTLVLVLDAGS